MKEARFNHVRTNHERRRDAGRMETALLVAFIAVGITAVSSIVDFVQTYHIRRVQNKLESLEKAWDERGDIGEQFGDYLMEAGDPDKPVSPENPTNLQIMAVQVGSVIAQSFNNAMKGYASGDARLVQKVDRAIMEGLQTPETQALLAFCDKVGLPRELVSLVGQRLGQTGQLSKLLGNNGHVEGKGNW